MLPLASRSSSLSSSSALRNLRRADSVARCFIAMENHSDLFSKELSCFARLASIPFEPAAPSFRARSCIIYSDIDSRVFWSYSLHYLRMVWRIDCLDDLWIVYPVPLRLLPVV